MTALAHELAADDILRGAGKLAHAEMHKVLDAAQKHCKAQIEAKRKAVMPVEGKTVMADMKGKSKSFDEFLEDADMAVIDDAYRRAARIFSPDISRTYVDVLAYRVADPDEADEFEAALVEARVSIALAQKGCGQLKRWKVRSGNRTVAKQHGTNGVASCNMILGWCSGHG